MTTIGERLAKIRQKTGLNTKEFGEKIGISNATVSNLETGTTPYPSVEVIINIKKAFNLSDEEIFELMFGEKYESSLKSKIAELEQENKQLLKANLKLIDQLPSNTPQPSNTKGEILQEVSRDTGKERRASDQSHGP